MQKMYKKMSSVTQTRTVSYFVSMGCVTYGITRHDDASFDSSEKLDIIETNMYKSIRENDKTPP